MKRITLFLLLCLPLASLAQQKLVGGDLSMLTKYEEASVAYSTSSGQRIDNLLTYLRDEAGYNIVRIRLFVNPTQETGVVQDIDYVKQQGHRVKDAGMKLMLDFHYSDTWADPSNQWTPSEWVNQNDEQLYTTIYEYTKEALQAMKEADATPDYIQTGNEISYGMMWGKKGCSESSLRKCYSNSPTANWTRFLNLLTRAGDACREVCPDAKIVIHSERSGDWTNAKFMFDKLASLDYDMIGLSYYPEWHGGLTTLSANLDKLAQAYPDKKLMIVETGYYNNWYPSTAAYNFTSTWPASSTGQKKFLDDLVSIIKDRSQVTALLYWFPEENPYNNHVYEPWYNHGLFNPNTGRVTDALFSMKAFLESSTGINMRPIVKTEQENIYAIDGKQLPTTANSPHGVYVVGGKKVVR